MLKMFRKDVRNRKDIFQKAFEQTRVSFNPCVGLDDNGINEPKAGDATRMAKPAKANIRELSRYAQR